MSDHPIEFDFDQDLKAHDDGVWFTPPVIQPPEDSMRPANRIKVRGRSYPPFEALWASMTREAARGTVDGDISTERAREIDATCILRHGLVDAEIHDKEGALIQLTHEIKRQLLFDRKHRNFYIACRWAQNQLERTDRHWETEAGKD